MYEIIAGFAPYVVATHVKNIKYQPEKREVQRELGWGYGEYVAPIYEGDLDHDRIAQTLAAAGYRGALNIEDESLGKLPAEERREVLRRNADHMAEITCRHGGTRCYAR